MELIVLDGEREEKVTVQRAGAGFRVTVRERTYEVDSRVTRRGARGGTGESGTDLLSLRVDGSRHHEVAVRRDPASRNSRYHVAVGAVATAVEVVDPLTHLARKAHDTVGRAGGQQITAYMPGRVVEVLVEEGAEVTAGQGVVVLEAMKMENEIQVDGAGIVRRIFVEAGQAVEGGDPLFEIE